jgi:signal transduction histidine kinase
VKVKVLLLIVSIYLVGAFSWWTYSLISLSSSDYEKGYKLLYAEAKLAQIQLDDSFKKAQIQADDTLALKKEMTPYLHNAFVLVFYPLDNAHFSVSLAPSPASLEKLNRELRSRKRAYYSEALFFMLLLLLGVTWVAKSIDKVVDLAKLQRNFMLSVTHELKTPVTAIKLMMQTLGKHNLDENKRNELIQKADANADRLTKLIDDLLFAVKIERKNLETHFEWVSPQAIIHELIESLSKQSAEKFTYNLDIPSEFKVWGDTLSLKVAFSNLIENAIKYSGEDLHLEIKTHPTKKQLFIRDNGIGIPASERRKVFRQFYRIGNEDIRTTKGTGIGLYLVKNILSIHKASIQIKPNLPKGTQFIIQFRK